MQSVQFKDIGGLVSDNGLFQRTATIFSKKLLKGDFKVHTQIEIVLTISRLLQTIPYLSKTFLRTLNTPEKQVKS